MNRKLISVLALMLSSNIYANCSVPNIEIDPSASHISIASYTCEVKYMQVFCEMSSTRAINSNSLKFVIYNISGTKTRTIIGPSENIGTGETIRFKLASCVNEPYSVKIKKY